MDKDPLFSVLIANYNNGCYLQETIDSVLVQNYGNWEVIIVDDKSTDNSFKIYDNYKNDSRFHVYFNEENMGTGYTKRRCVEMARGEICGFLDPDDVLVGTNVFEEMVQTHLAHLYVSLVYSDMYMTDVNLNVVSEWLGRDVPEGSSALEFRDWPFSHFATFKKEYYLKTEGVNAAMQRAVDYDLYYKLEEVGSVKHINHFFYKYRNTPNSISLNEKKPLAHVWHVYACVEAMRRRGLRDESLMLFPLESDMREQYANGYKRACNTKTYRIGEFVTLPLRLFRKVLGKESAK